MTSQDLEDIKYLRIKLGLSLRKLASLVNVSATHIKDIETKRRNPSPTLARNIKIALINYARDRGL